VWYYTPYYAMLRVVPDKLGGVIVMFAAIAVLFLVPWLDRAKVKSIRYRGLISKLMLSLLVVCFVWLGVIGSGPGTAIWETWVGRVLTLLYFAFFITMPVWTRIDRTKPVPERVTTHD
jgi:ubiquinol-cytochrome c reductase cytochrome b subunit